IRIISELEKTGAKILVIQANVANPIEMEQAVCEAEKHFGAIDGVFHCAGGVGENSYIPVREIENAQSHEQLQPKMDGLIVLNEILAQREKNPGFFCLMSSLASVLGGLGFATYSAANIFMDTFAKLQNRSGNIDWYSINWDAWQMADEEKQRTGIGAALQKLALTPEEGMEVLEQVLNRQEPGQTVISTANLQQRIEKSTQRDGTVQEATETGKPAHDRPALSTPYLAPKNPKQETMAAIWAEFFSIDKIGIHDDFHELGGDSLKAISLVSMIREELKVDVPLATIFNCPTIEAISGYVQQQAGAPHPTVEEITPAEAKEYYSLAPAQKRLYFLWQMEPSGTAYNLPLPLQMEGLFNKTKIQNTFQEVIQRHESLRTSFHQVDGQPLQKIHEEVEFEIEYYAEKEEGNDEIQTRLHQAQHAFVRPFDLSKPPLLRVGFPAKAANTGAMAQGKYIVIVDMHHIISDGVSKGIFMNEFMEIYSGKKLPPQKRAYKDYSEWLARPGQKKELKKQERYWLQQMAGEVPVLELPTDFIRPPVRSYEGDYAPFSLDAEVTTHLKELAEKENATLYQVLASLFYIFLSRLSSGTEDIIIGMPTAGRKYTGIQQMVGMFVNTLPLRNKPEGSKTYTAFLAEVAKGSLEALENQEYPLEDLVAQLQVTRKDGHSPLVDTLFVLQNIQLPVIEIPGLALEHLTYRSNTAKFDLSLEAEEKEGKLEFILEYAEKLFKKETAKRFTTYYKELAKSILQHPGEKIANLEMIPAEERNQLLIQFNDTEADYPAGKTLHGLFEEQVEKTPENRCTEARDRENQWQELSYRQLNEKARQLAHRLQEKGVGPDTIVPVMAERSNEMVIAIMGILKAGGAYLPIDPAYPEERIKFMLTDSSATLLITQTGKEVEPGKLPPGCEQISPARQEEQNNGAPDPPAEYSIRNSAPATRQPESDNPHPASGLAYIIYTSGTTGRPKGVAIEHQNVVNSLTWRKKEYGLTTRDKTLQLFSYSFDGFVTGFFTPVISGTLVIMPGAEDIKEPHRLREIIVTKEITHFISVPSLYEALLEILTGEELAQVRTVTLAGEKIPAALVARSKEKNSAIEIINEYGATENSVVATIYRQVEPGENIPVGKPVANTAIYIVDNDMKLQPVGAAGEICIAGKGIARGYINRPQLTAEKFVNNPFTNPLPKNQSPITNIQLYRTGDLGRWRPDGNIEYIGRNDYQVKIRGFRIE
ncbi:MAG: amino acid adenylation domain-containing protein, partial [bacterium]|nr:amino acid adenylation domain-containing protein [bacterium]